MEIEKTGMIAVVGAGTMGIGIAQIAARAGHHVHVIDADERALIRGSRRLGEELERLVERGRLDDAERAAMVERIRWTSDIAAAAPAVLAIEAIVEKLDVKRDLFARLASIVGPECLLASNTSSLSINALASEAIGPARFVGLHFFNPVPAMQLVELIPATGSSAAAIDAAARLVRSWGKRPVVVRDVPGFIVNRVARPYYAEGFAALDDGMAPGVVDALLTGAGGFRMGPLALTDLIGQDVNFAVALSVFESYGGNTRFRPQPRQRALVEAGTLGRKSGRGVYGSDQAAMVLPFLEAGRPPETIRVSDAPTGLVPLINAARAAGVSIVEDSLLKPDALVVEGVVIAPGDGRRLADRRDCDVLLDAARDLAGTTLLGITASSPRAARAASAFLAMIGRRTLEIPDRPGQLVLRTLAQLANAAADAVRDDVASAEDIDTAMVLGANHPEGPLAWAERAGKSGLADALAATAAAAGDDIYSPSPWFSGTEAAGGPLQGTTSVG